MNYFIGIAPLYNPDLKKTIPPYHMIDKLRMSDPKSVGQRVGQWFWNTYLKDPLPLGDAAHDLFYAKDKAARAMIKLMYDHYQWEL